MKQKKCKVIMCFVLLMAGLGSNDALRGIFAPVFQERYILDSGELSMMVTASYVGNLLFLSIGGKLFDIFSRKKIMTIMLGIWACTSFFNLITDQYLCIIVSMFFALGASTFLNTAVNILTPVFFAESAGLMVNLFFFVQGIGTSGSQFLLGRYAFHYEGWKMINLFLLVSAVIVILLFMFIKIPNKGYAEMETAQTSNEEPEKRVLWVFIIMMGCYFISEHGIMNWMLPYCISAFSMENMQASTYLAIFWGGMTVGRLLLAPAVQSLGSVKSLKLFGGIGTVMFCIGCICGGKGVWLLGTSGFVISIIYPTMVLLIQEIYLGCSVATKTGTIISVATVADILFNILFGTAVMKWGYRISFMILPVCMCVFYVSLWKMTCILQKHK